MNSKSGVPRTSVKYIQRFELPTFCKVGWKWGGLKSEIPNPSPPCPNPRPANESSLDIEMGMYYYNHLSLNNSFNELLKLP